MFQKDQKVILQLMMTLSYLIIFLLIICHILFKLEIFLKKKSKSKLTEKMTVYKFKYYCTEKLAIMNRRLTDR